MSRPARLAVLAFAACLGLAATSPAGASTIVNGGFETGFTSWVRVDQVGSAGTFALQTGLASPVNADPVPAPPSGTRAAMSDGAAPGAHVLYQDFVATPGSQTLSFDLFIGNRADRFATPASLDSDPLIDHADFESTSTTLSALQRAAVEKALADSNGHRTRAAEALGISVRTLQRKLKTWGLGGSESQTQPEVTRRVHSGHA